MLCHTPATYPALSPHTETRGLRRTCKGNSPGHARKGTCTQHTSIMMHEDGAYQKAQRGPKEDLQTLNRSQNTPTTPPLQQAHTVPHNTLKSTNDAWNGFHSQKLREKDRHYTMFIYPYGRYCNITAPQGWLATGDMYTQRFHKITESVKNKHQVIDNSLLYSKNIKKAFA